MLAQEKTKTKYVASSSGMIFTLIPIYYIPSHFMSQVNQYLLDAGAAILSIWNDKKDSDQTDKTAKEKIRKKVLCID